MAKSNQQKISPERLIRERGRSLEIHECLMDRKCLEQYGETTVIVTRKHKGDKYTMCSYLLDAYCLGIKDTFYRVRMDEYEYKSIVSSFDKHDFDRVDYVEAHNWIFGAVEFAREAGIEPHKDFAVTKWLLEDDEDENIPIIEYEFGKDGKHFLIVHSQAEADKYLPILTRNLGEGNFNFLTGFAGQPMKDVIERCFGGGTEDTKYEYEHPEYPAVLNIKNHDLIGFMADWNEKCPTKEAIDSILSLDRDTLREDLHNLILFETGCTCDGISLERREEFSSLMSYALFLLGEVGDRTSVDVVLECLRQNEDYMEYHFGDYAEEIFASVLSKLAQDDLDSLYRFLMEPGLFSFAKSHVFSAVYFMGHHWEEIYEDAVDWFRKALTFIAAELPLNRKCCDSTLAGFAAHYAIDLARGELLPEIEALYETGLMNTAMEGTLEDVKEYIRDPKFGKYRAEYTVDIYEAFDKYARFCEFK